MVFSSSSSFICYVWFHLGFIFWNQDQPHTKAPKKKKKNLLILRAAWTNSSLAHQRKTQTSRSIMSCFGMYNCPPHVLGSVTQQMLKSTVAQVCMKWLACAYSSYSSFYPLGLAAVVLLWDEVLICCPRRHGLLGSSNLLASVTWVIGTGGKWPSIQSSHT